MVSLCAEVASAYFNLREAQQELSVLQRNALSQKAVVDMSGQQVFPWREIRKNG